jgi:hypothetical protein
MRIATATIRLFALSVLPPLTLAGIGLGIAPAAAALEGAAPAVLRSFQPAYFQRFAPRTALEMVRQTPGFDIDEGQSKRGLGEAAGNVLINGRRIASKSTGISTALSRIAAGRVVRLDIVDGATLGIPGLSGQVVNVVTRPGGLSGRWSWSPTLRTDREPSLLNGSVSVSGASLGVDYTLALNSYEATSGQSGPEIATGADGVVFDVRQEDRQSLRQEPSGALTLSHESDSGNLLNVNLSGGRRHYGGREISFRSGPGLPDRLNLYRDGGDGWNGELGADYEFAAGGGRLKLIGLERINRDAPASESLIYYDSAAPTTGSRYGADRASGESILRGEYSWLDGADRDWQVAVEGAFNYLDVQSELESLEPDGTFAIDPLAIGSSRVEEQRAEANLTHGRALIGAVNLQASAGVEYSQLAQSGPAGQAREFVRPKGYLALSWRDADALDLSFRVERSVGQLSFDDFIDSVSLIDGNSDSGNPEIVPPQQWTADFKASRDLGAYGAVNMRVYANWIEDLIAKIPFGANSEGPGNLGTLTTVYGLQLSGTLKLDPLGLSGVKVDWSTNLAASDLTDPLTGQSRETGGRELGGFWLGFRQDVPETDWAWGVSYGQSHHAPDYRLDQRASSTRDVGGADIYLVNKDILGVSATLTVRNLLDSGDRYQRIVYDQRRGGPISYIEDRVRRSGPEVGLSLSNSF